MDGRQRPDAVPDKRVILAEQPAPGLENLQVQLLRLLVPPEVLEGLGNRVAEMQSLVRVRLLCLEQLLELLEVVDVDLLLGQRGGGCGREVPRWRPS